MVIQLFSDLKEIVCGIEEVLLAFTLILASVRMEKFAVLVSTSRSPPNLFAMFWNEWLFHKSKSKPVIAIHPMNLETLVPMTFTDI